ncbi:MAG: alpha-amylase, partial [Anaerolineae bacterium]|nr:alpha-amylase [Anaerolineae bacterium]
MLNLAPMDGLYINTAYEFHISRVARDRYQFDASLFSLQGHIIFANFHATRLFAQRMNEKRDLINFPEQSVKAGHLNAMGLADEIQHYLLKLYREQYVPEMMAETLSSLVDHFGQDTVDRILLAFIIHFPPTLVYKAQVSPETYLEGTSQGIPNREIALEEMLMVWLANRNPAKMA